MTNTHLDAAAVIRRQHKNLQITLRPKPLQQQLTQKITILPSPFCQQQHTADIHYMRTTFSFLGELFPFATSPVQHAPLLVRCLKKSKAAIALHLWSAVATTIPCWFSWDRHWASRWQPGSWNVSERAAQISEQPSQNSFTTYTS